MYTRTMIHVVRRKGEKVINKKRNREESVILRRIALVIYLYITREKEKDIRIIYFEKKRTKKRIFSPYFALRIHTYIYTCILRKIYENIYPVIHYMLHMYDFSYKI